MCQRVSEGVCQKVWTIDSPKACCRRLQTRPHEHLTEHKGRGRGGERGVDWMCARMDESAVLGCVRGWVRAYVRE